MWTCRGLNPPDFIEVVRCLRGFEAFAGTQLPSISGFISIFICILYGTSNLCELYKQ